MKPVKFGAVIASVAWAVVAPELCAQATRASTTQPARAADPNLPARLVELGSRGVRLHDPSTIVKCKDEYWLFSTGRGISSHRSKDLVNWRPGPAVFDVRPPWTLEAVPEHRGGEQGHYWAPDVIHIGGKYLLYYSVSTFGRNTSAIGLVTNRTLDPADPEFRWVDQGIVIRSTARDKFNAIDPALTLDAGGKLWMSFGSFWSGIKLVELDPATGKRVAEDSPVHPLAHYESIEAPFIYRHGGHYYLFLNWGVCCRGVRSTYNIRVGRSENVTGPYLDKTGTDLLKGGGTLLLQTHGPMIGPGHPGIIAEGGKHWLSFHYYDPTRRGTGVLAIRRLTWDTNGWPVVE